ncbi:hypothetical protein [Synechococcus sp. CS-1328]|uniref:hypothetical protein n=1 Tax=Synechococcus sp. CS-1328 TaxID=2847976 RepID=UPI00223AB7F8|nr:hypothetical protein [Synechococcus sp. CS-1328]MCT0223909.1 hypothetical protein [Synechococcus sp. CS-1328]
MPPLKLIYITSNSHSGSTLLDMLIGSHSACLTLGEIHKLTAKSEGECACGASSFATCLFWQDVSSRLEASGSPPLADLQIHATDPVAFRDANRCLLTVLQQKTGCAVFVDSSKKLSRLKLLLQDPDLQVLPVHIVRRPEGVVCSNIAKGRPWGEELEIYHRNLWPRYDLLRHHPHLLVSYESLCRQPEQVLGRIMQAAGLAFEPDQLDWTRHEHHNVNGNKRTRTSRASTIRLDERWRRQLSRRQRLAIRLAQARFRLRLLLRFGLWPRPL